MHLAQAVREDRSGAVSLVARMTSTFLTGRMQPPRLFQLPVPSGILHRGVCCNLGCPWHLLKEAADGIGWLGLKLRLATGVLFKTACN